MTAPEVVLFDADFPWGERVVSCCHALNLHPQRMRLTTGIGLVDWNRTISVVLAVSSGNRSSVVETLATLQKQQPHVKCLVYLSREFEPEDEWRFRELGAVWVFWSVFEVDRVERILRRLVNHRG